jgi:hypothetical protein
MIMRNTLLCLLVVLLATGCVTKKNRVGFDNSSNVHPREVILSDVLDSYYSYEDTAKAYVSNPYSLAGMSRGTRAVSLIRFASVPEVDYSNARLVLYPTDLTHGVGLNLHIGLVRESWTEDQATWGAASTSTAWTDPDHKYDPVADCGLIIAAADSIVIPLPDSLLDLWNSDDDENYGMAIYSEDPTGYIVWNSRYSGTKGPLLRFEYVASGATTTSRYSMAASADANLFDKAVDNTTFDTMEINSAAPERMFVQCDLSLDAFQAALPDTAKFADEQQFKRSTINRAELVIPVDATGTEFVTSQAAVYALLVYGDNPTVPIASTHLKAFAYTDASYMSSGADHISVDVTPLVQAIIAGTYPNHGFVIRAYYESRDFTHVKFSPDDVKLRVIYTLPYTED